MLLSRAQRAPRQGAVLPLRVGVSRQKLVFTGDGPSPDRLRIPGPVVRYLQESVLTKGNLKEATNTQTAAPTWLVAVRAAEAKQAAELVVLDLTGITAFADFFVICTGANQKQVQAISDEVGLKLKHEAGELPTNIEGYSQAEWVLADYGDMLVHIFSPKAREYYGLERLWRGARHIEIPPE